MSKGQIAQKNYIEAEIKLKSNIIGKHMIQEFFLMARCSVIGMIGFGISHPFMQMYCSPGSSGSPGKIKKSNY